MNPFLKSKNIHLIVISVINFFPLIAYAVHLVEGIDYNYGNGKGAPVAEVVAGYAHKESALDHFTARRISAINHLESILSSEGGDVLTNYRKLGQVHPLYANLAMDSGYARGSGEKVRFFTRAGLEKCQVFLINRKFYHYDERKELVLYNSQQAILDGFTGDIIVMDQQGNIFIHPKEMGFIHHSSFFSQKPIAFAAMVRIRNGEMMRSDFTKDDLSKVTIFPNRVRGSDCPEGLLYYSGHYDPNSGTAQVKNQIKQDALENFKKQLTMVHLITQDLDRSDQIEFIKSEVSFNYFDFYVTELTGKPLDAPCSIKIAKKCQELGYHGHALRIIRTKLGRITAEKDKYDNAHALEKVIILIAKINADLSFFNGIFIDGGSALREACNLYKKLAYRSHRDKIAFFCNNYLWEWAESIALEYVDYDKDDNTSYERKIKDLLEFNFKKYGQIVAERYAVTQNFEDSADSWDHYFGSSLWSYDGRTKEEKAQFLEMHGFNDIARKLRGESAPCSIQ